MVHLIDKDALVAEIKRRINKEIQRCAVDLGYSQGHVDSMRNILSFIDTLEVKEVDLEEELENWLGERIGKWTGKECENMCRYFFELGMRVNSPITAADRGMAEEIIVNLKRVEQDYHIDLTREMEWLINKAQKGE